MADVTQTPANVGVASVNSPVRIVQVGEAVTQGQPGYRLESDGKYYQTDADAESTAEAAGIFLTPAALDGYAVFALPGAIVKPGATLTAGTMYYVSPTKGAICDASSLLSGDYVTALGVGDANGDLILDINASGVAKA